MTQPSEPEASEPRIDPDPLSEWSEHERNSLLEAIDESDYSFADWIAALGAFDRWLADRGESRRPRKEMVGYIHCCTFGNAPGIALAKLEIIVYESLTEYGFILLDDTQI